MSPLSLASARFKIQRADKHIADFDAIVAALPKANIVATKRDEQTGLQQVECELPNSETIMPELALIVGDAIHNFKTALDYGWAATIDRLAPHIRKFSKFPVYPTRTALEGALKSRKIEVAAPTLFERIVADIKPYEGGNNALWRLHKLDILDKHHLLIPSVQALSLIGVTLENEKGETMRGNTFPVIGSGPHWLPVEGNWHVKDQGTPTVAIVFQDVLGLECMEVSSMLHSFRPFVMSALYLLESL